MKNLAIILSVTIISCIAGSKVEAQNSNIARLGISNIAMGNISVGYERTLNDKLSANLHFQYLIPRTPPKMVIEVEETGTTESIKTTLKGMSFAPELRFYPGSNGAPRGFYLAPYFRYNYYALKYGTTVDGFDYEATGSISSIGGGVQFGTQWIINDVFVIDWYFATVGVNSWTLGIKYESDDPLVDFDEEAESIKTDVEDILVFTKKDMDTETGDDYVKAKLGGIILPAFRFGLSIGIAF